MENTSWLFTQTELEQSPSRLAGLSIEMENRYRQKGIYIIKKIGQAMNQKHYPTLATASVFFHRFYVFHSFIQYSPYVPALACLFLAGKVEDIPKKCKDLVLKAQEIFPVEYIWLTADELILIERLLLQTIRFDLYIEHPVTKNVSEAKIASEAKNFFEAEIASEAKNFFEAEIVSEAKIYSFLVQYAKITNAWTFVNDSLTTNICLLWEPEIIAIAMLFMAFKMTKLEIGEENLEKIVKKEEEEENDWWEEQKIKVKQKNYVSNLTKEMIEEICHRVLDVVDTDNLEK
ncbi:hypothetical protein Mgra_00006505 [Meloidogyne graminicola]|uniref:Cyclin-like domain-containing protein n=1 Tax=Meloidogyne graminicola TaxID=189291 RepID=A0A8S9ZLU4_9BILA|nr:hypothetical protein Mgra_00006505 [Meloidogyne graminicola]